MKDLSGHRWLWITCGMWVFPSARTPCSLGRSSWFSRLAITSRHRPGGQDVYLIYPALLAKWAAECSPVAKPEDAERIGVKEKGWCSMTKTEQELYSRIVW